MANEKPEWLKDNGDGTVDITLSRPLDLGGAKTAFIRMREPTVADQLAADANKGSDAEKEMAMMVNLCNLVPDDLRKLPLRDYKRLQVSFMSFIG